MPRVARHDVPGVAYHAVSRFIDHRFELDATTRPAIHGAIGRVFQRNTDWQVLAYALMSSHWHLVCVAGNSPSSSWTRPLNTAIARKLQDTRVERGERALGAVFAGRPTFVAIPPERVAQVIAYVHLNPVRAGVVSRASDSTWTSHRAITGLEPSPRWLRAATALRKCGFSPSRDGRAKFDHFVQASSGTGAEDLEWNETAIADAWRAARRVAGDEGVIGAPALDPHRGAHFAVGSRAQEARVRPPDPSHLIGAIAMTAGVTARDLCSKRRDRTIMKCRRLALRYWTADGGRVEELASAFGIHKSTAYALLSSSARRGA